MPVYDMLGGKCRNTVPMYAHADVREPKEVAEDVRKYMEQGYRHVRADGWLWRRRDDTTRTRKPSDLGVQGSSFRRRWVSRRDSKLVRILSDRPGKRSQATDRRA